MKTIPTDWFFWTCLQRCIARRQLEPNRPDAQAVVRAVANAHRLTPEAALQRQSGQAFKHSVYLLRRRANLSLKEVARKAGVSIGRVAQIQSEIESGQFDSMLGEIVAVL